MIQERSITRRAVTALLLILTLCSAAGVGTLDVRVEGQTLTLHADDVPLQDILAALAAQGFRIRVDKEINPGISASFTRRDLQKGLASLLRSLNYALIWEAVPGPLGPLPRLAEIQVFRPGRKDRLTRLGITEKRVLSVEQDPVKGGWYVSDEILLRPRAGVAIADFEKLLQDFGGMLLEGSEALRLYRVRLPRGSDVPSLVEDLLQDPRVARAEANHAYAALPPQGLPPGGVPSAGKAAASKGDGNGIPIAILDSGLQENSGLDAFVLAGLDALETSLPLTDSVGHGTQMALIATGTVTPQGVARAGSPDPGPPIIPIRAFDDLGHTSSFAIMGSIDFALQHGAQIMSMSWGTEQPSQFLEEAFAHARANGLVLIAAAGNEPTGRPMYPAAYPSVIGVGALTPEGQSWERSNYGESVLIAAPGFASFPEGYEGASGQYAGTSIAAAYAANRMADYLSRHPGATVEEFLGTLRGGP